MSHDQFSPDQSQKTIMHLAINASSSRCKSLVSTTQVNCWNFSLGAMAVFQDWSSENRSCVECILQSTMHSLRLLLLYMHTAVILLNCMLSGKIGITAMSILLRCKFV